MVSQRKMRYVLVGGFNTLIGYFIGVGVYKVLGIYLSIFWIGAISSSLSIMVSFLNYKLLVFKTKGSWLNECLKAYLVYGGVSVFGIFLLWLFIDKMRLSIWISQALVIGVTVIISYMSHSRFTFNRRKIL